MEELQARHRKEARDLQAQVTQKKKSASKKTRKAVNDECARLEEDMEARHAREVADASGDAHVKTEANGDPDGPVQDADILDSIAQSTQTLDTNSKTSNGDVAEQQSEQQQKKPNRQKARMARKAAEQQAAVEQAKEEAANMPDKKRDERNRMVEEFEKRGLNEKIVPATGHCLYYAFADQLKVLDVPLVNLALVDDETGEQPEGKAPPDYTPVRKFAAAYISKHPDDFVPFMEEPLDEYVHKVRDTAEWGGHLELLALAKAYGVNINVLQDHGRVESIESGSNGDVKTAWLAYYKHGFGLGEHYNSLRSSPT